ncbi:hypothetical protein [Celeribacter sp.]|uniref:hypothetical protein n=1 Tax=Celeribacter sp. TaxID=1890673 RepID=UPI003A8C9B19
MIRVSLNLNALIHARDISPSTAGRGGTADYKSDLGRPLSEHQPHLTREEVCETFADKAWCRAAIEAALKKRDEIA